jgi:hypothetical protein
MSKESVSSIFKEVELNVNKNMKKKLSSSLTHCHFKNVYSVWLTDTIRVFYTEGDIDGVSSFDSETPHKNNEKFLIHDHRHPLTSVPLFGIQENIKYKIVEMMEEECDKYKEYLFYSAILSGESKARHEFVQEVVLKKVESSLNVPWFMEKQEIHRVYWKGSMMALLKEHREVDEVSKTPTRGYLVSHEKNFPCGEGLYQPISEEKFEEITKLALDSIKNFII